MIFPKKLLMAASAAALLALQNGCSWCQSRCNSCNSCNTCPPGSVRGVAPSPLPPRFVPGAPTPVAVPSGALVPASPVPVAPVAPSVPGAPPSVQGSYSIPIPPEPNWKPLTDPGVRLAPPETAIAQAPRAAPPAAVAPSEAPRAAAPSTPEPPVASVPSPPAKEPTGGTPPLPVDIPQFALARPRVAAGQQPFPDGVVWLQANGYKTVLHIHRPGDDEAAARRLFEKHGLRYEGLTVDPQSLNKDTVERFNRFVSDEANLPLFVYDKDGSLAGGLWYLHVRQTQGATDDRARSEAARLGFKQDGDGEHRTMWVAVQNYLKTLMPKVD